MCIHAGLHTLADAGKSINLGKCNKDYQDSEEQAVQYESFFVIAFNVMCIYNTET